MLASKYILRFSDGAQSDQREHINNTFLTLHSFPHLVEFLNECMLKKGSHR